MEPARSWRKEEEAALMTWSHAVSVYSNEEKEWNRGFEMSELVEVSTLFFLHN